VLKAPDVCSTHELYVKLLIADLRVAN